VHGAYWDSGKYAEAAKGQLPLSTNLECMKTKTKNGDRLC